MRRFLLISLVLVMPASLAAQRGGFGHFSGHRAGRFAAGFGRGGYGRSGRYGLPFFDPFFRDYFPDFDYSAPAPVVLVQTQQAAAAQPEPASPPAQSLMIELQGDRYVQVSGDQASSGQAQMIDPTPAAARSRATAKVQPERVPTTLVFRDGRREEVSDYTIADGVLYASADYYSTGAWNQKIPLSSLNLDETVSLNRARGVEFRLPSAPNEVIVGP
jgi:hypothetical protein